MIYSGLQSKITRTFVPFLFLLSSCYHSLAQDKTLPNLDKAKQLSSEAAELFKEEKITELVKKLAPYWPISDSEIESFVDKTNNNLALIKESYGSPFAVRKIKEQSISDISFRETYLVQYNKSAIRLIFTYYHNEKGWILNSFKWDDSFMEEFNK